jgi:hypothetical protein
MSNNSASSPRKRGSMLRFRSLPLRFNPPCSTLVLQYGFPLSRESFTAMPGTTGYYRSNCADTLNVLGAPASKYPPSAGVTSRQ